MISSMPPSLTIQHHLSLSTSSTDHLSCHRDLLQCLYSHYWSKNKVFLSLFLSYMGVEYSTIIGLFQSVVPVDRTIYPGIHIINVSNLFLICSLVYISRFTSIQQNKFSITFQYCLSDIQSSVLLCKIFFIF